MQKEAIRKAINDGAIHYLRLLADAEHMALEDDGFCTLMRPKDGAQGGTSLFDFRFEGLPDEELARKIKEVKEKNVHTFMGCWLPENVESIMKRDYPAPEEEDPELYMAILPDERPEYRLPEPPVAVRAVETPADFSTWVGIANAVLHGDYLILHPENHYHLCQSGKLRCYLGLFDGTPVSTAAIMDDNGIASMEFVATREECQRKGVGGAVCRVAVEQAFRAGAKIITLRAFSPGQRLYKSIGFQTY